MFLALCSKSLQSTGLGICFVCSPQSFRETAGVVFVSTESRLSGKLNLWDTANLANLASKRIEPVGHGESSESSQQENNLRI